MIVLSLKIKITSNWAQSDESRIKFTYLVGMIADQNMTWHVLHFLSYSFSYGQRPKAEVCQGQTFGCGRRWKLHLQSNTSVWLFGDSIMYTKVSENILMYIYYVFTTQCIFIFIDKKVNMYFQDILSVLHVRTITKVTKDRKISSFESY